MAEDFSFSVVDEACVRAGFPEVSVDPLNPLGTDLYDNYVSRRAASTIDATRVHCVRLRRALCEARWALCEAL